MLGNRPWGENLKCTILKKMTFFVQRISSLKIWCTQRVGNGIVQNTVTNETRMANESNDSRPAQGLI